MMLEWMAIGFGLVFTAGVVWHASRPSPLDRTPQAKREARNTALLAFVCLAVIAALGAVAGVDFDY